MKKTMFCGKCRTTWRHTFCKLEGFSCVLSMILMATSLPVGKCLANFTFAKFPFPIVFNSLYRPICGSSEVRLLPVVLMGFTWIVSSFCWPKIILDQMRSKVNERFRLLCVRIVVIQQSMLSNDSTDLISGHGLVNCLKRRSDTGGHCFNGWTNWSTL